MSKKQECKWVSRKGTGSQQVLLDGHCSLYESVYRIYLWLALHECICMVSQWLCGWCILIMLVSRKCLQDVGVTGVAWLYLQDAPVVVWVKHPYLVAYHQLQPLWINKAASCHYFLPQLQQSHILLSLKCVCVCVNWAVTVWHEDCCKT